MEKKKKNKGIVGATIFSAGSLLAGLFAGAHAGVKKERWRIGNECQDELSKMYPQVIPPPDPNDRWWKHLFD